MDVVSTKFYEYGQLEIEHLKQADESLGAAIERIGKLERVVMPDLFCALVYAITGQLISAKATHAIWLRLQQRLHMQTNKPLQIQTHMQTNKPLQTQEQLLTRAQIQEQKPSMEKLTPQAVSRLTVDELRDCGLTLGKAQCIKAVADSIAQGETDLEELRCLQDEEVIARLTAWRGIGKWTAEMLLIHGMERPDVVSRGDIAIRRGMMKLYRLPGLTQTQFEQYRRRYSPYGTVAAIYLWEISFQ